jgi:predicted GTPase
MKRNKKQEKELTQTEKYYINREIRHRAGYLGIMRQYFTSALKVYGREQNYKVSKDLLRKIQYETDAGYLKKLLHMVVDGEMPVKDLEENYEKIFRTNEDIISEKYTIYHGYSEYDEPD